MAITKKIDESKEPAFNMGLAKDNPRFKVIFLETDNMDGGTRATACVNGENYSYKRGVEVDVPDYVLYAFDQAVYEVKRNNSDETMRIKRFPYQIVG